MAELMAGLQEVFERSSKIVQTPRLRLSDFQYAYGTAVQISRFRRSNPIRICKRVACSAEVATYFDISTL